MKYYDRCGDCGQGITEHTHSGRADVCDTCWENRGWLLKNHTLIGTAEFQKIQRSMAYKTGIAKRKIEKLKKALEVDGEVLK